MFTISSIQGIYGYRTLWTETDESLARYSNHMLSANVLIIKTWLGTIERIFSSVVNKNFYDVPALRQDLQQASNSGGFEAVYIGRFNKAFYQNETAGDVPSTYDPRVRPWYQAALKNQGEIIYTPPYLSAGENAGIVITVAQSILDGKAVLGGDVTLSVIKSVVDKMKSKVAFGLLVNEAGDIVAYEDTNFLLKPVTDLSSSLSIELIQSLEGEAEIEPYEIEILGVDYFISAEKIDNKTGWYLLLAVDKSKIYASVYELGINMIISSMVLIILSVLLVLMFVRYSLKALILTNVAMNELAKGEGDLTLRLEAKGNDEIAELASGVNLFLAKLHTIISEIVASGNLVNKQSIQFHDMAAQTKESLSDQQREVTQIAAAVHEMSATAVEVANNAEATASATIQSNEHCEQGKAVIIKNQASITNLASEIEKTSNAISELEANTQNINTILSTIQDIAEQTNLLALNAAIEAARAGDQGRGFAVVADEVRVLSQRTHGSTEEIRGMIETLLVNTESAVNTMEKSASLANNSVEEANNATNALEEISRSIQQISDMSTHIASAAEEQRAVTEEVSRNVQSVSKASDDMVQAATGIVDMSDKLNDVSKGLSGQVGQFKL
ncbi:MAG: methyl-accepting chemotaxis protein [Shewanellaceae bacterium]|nr:methyl-accepting chemotaxis protein [Shewanellaceae bacterium]